MSARRRNKQLKGSMKFQLACTKHQSCSWRMRLAEMVQKECQRLSAHVLFVAVGQLVQVFREDPVKVRDVSEDVEQQMHD